MATTIAKPFLTLTSKQFLSGIGQTAHTELGGLFYKADGITPLIEPGTAQSANNGLLMAGPAATQVLGNLNGTVISSANAKVSGPTSLAFFGTSTGHIFQLTVDSTFASTLSDAHTVSALRQGLIDFNGFLFYFRDTNIGRYDYTSTWTDSWDTISSESIHCVHRFFNNLLYGNSQAIGLINSSFTNNKSALSIAPWPLATDISDDGVYAVIAVTDNLGRDPSIMANTQILFWDGFSSNWNRQYAIPDPYIISLHKTNTGVFAVGVTGIWQVSYGKEPVKVFSSSPGVYTAGTYTNLMYGTYNVSNLGSALLWGGASGSNAVIKSLGQLDASAPSSHLTPFLSTAGKNITMIDAQILKGWVYVADDTPLLKAYPFSSANAAQTGVTAQTQYIRVPQKTSVNRIDVIFGAPMASGDALNIQLKNSESESAITYGLPIAYNATKMQRRVSLFGTFVADDVMSALINYTGGNPKIKALEFYSDPMTP